MGRRITPSPARIAAFQRKIWSFYRRAGRHHLPWRRTRDPYRILVSEIMLQQTQVPRVLEFYPRFIRRFPDFRALARAPLSAALRAWQGLGYNRRALFLRRIAKTVVREHGGELPRDPAVLRILPGIGAGTAGSLAAFAFDSPASFIETNIRRAFIHEFFPHRRMVSDAEILPLVAATLDRRRPREWYYALMDYGAMLARALPKHRNPNRRSAGYARQGRFEGSDRELRGGILKILLSGSRSSGELRTAFSTSPRRIRAILARLKKEGFIRSARGQWKLM